MQRTPPTPITALSGGLVFCIAAVLFQIFVIGNLETGTGGIQLLAPWQGFWLIANLIPYWASILVSRNPHMPNYLTFFVVMAAQWFTLGYLLIKAIFRIRKALCLSPKSPRA